MHLGIQPVTVKVSDGRGGEAVQTFEIAVTEHVNRPPQIVSTPPASVNEGASSVYDVDAMDPDGGCAELCARGLASANIQSASGLLSWSAGPGYVGSIRAPNLAYVAPLAPGSCITAN